MAALEGNTNRAKHGARTDRPIVLGEWGKRHVVPYQHGRKLRRVLECHVRESQGDIPLGAAMQIDEATRWEVICKITQRLIATTADMPVDQTVTCLKTIAWAVKQRNAAIGRLGIDGATPGTGSGLTQADIEALYSQPQEPPGRDAATGVAEPADPTERSLDATGGPASGR